MTKKERYEEGEKIAPRSFKVPLSLWGKLGKKYGKNRSRVIRETLKRLAEEDSDNLG